MVSEDRPGATDQDPIYIFNLFRVRGGKLAEHWDGSSRPIGSQSVTGAAGTS
jgi:predicted SnoaL-like aldol condensation-catalyzing enzyme